MNYLLRATLRNTTEAIPVITFEISGTIYDKDNNPITSRDVTVKLVRGNKEVKLAVTTNASGEYSFTGVEIGSYSVAPDPEPIITTSDPLEIVIPFDFTDIERDSVKVYRYHEENGVSSVDTLTTTPSGGESITLNPDSITLHVKKFSTYAIGYTKIGSAGGSESSSTVDWAECPKDAACPIWAYSDAVTMAWYHDGVHTALKRA